LDKIYFHDFNTKSNLRNKRLLKEFLLKLFKDFKVKIQQIDIVFCTDSYLRSINKKFLNHNYNTDTITFNYSEFSQALAGEGYISIDRVKENAASYGITYQEELIRVIIHSCLHLCGFLDKPKSNLLRMRKIQERYLQKWIVSRETQIG
jgi:probable rRNA maturation factor